MPPAAGQGERLPSCSCKPAPTWTPLKSGTAVQSLWALYQSLKRGEVPDLPRHPVPSGDLTCLLGYGVKAFELTEARRTIPEELQQFGRFRPPLTSGGGSLLTGSGQWYADDVKKNPATEIMAVQFIADTQLAVNRAVVETWKFLHDQAQTPPGPVLHLAGFFQGFQRDDHRSWLDFHDGTSNLPSDRREEAIVIKDTSAGDDQWTVGGTYMTYLRITIDLAVWRRLTREQQELHVGRDKLPGCPLAFSDGMGNNTPADGCPVNGTGEVGEPGNEAFHEPANVASESPLRFSHVQQVNHHRQDFDARDSLRIFRQGYEFLEPVDGAPGFRAGLNFVSFQDTPERLFRMLTTPGWLGRTNFGGNPDRPLAGMDRFLTVRAAGVYLVPPVVAEETFPGGQHLFAGGPKGTDLQTDDEDPRTTHLPSSRLLMALVREPHQIGGKCPRPIRESTGNGVRWQASKIRGRHPRQMLRRRDLALDGPQVTDAVAWRMRTAEGLRVLVHFNQLGALRVYDDTIPAAGISGLRALLLKVV